MLTWKPSGPRKSWAIRGPMSGWGWVVEYWAVRANMWCVAFYIRLWRGCTVLYAGLGRGWAWRWRVLHRTGRLNWLHSAMQNSAVQKLFWMAFQSMMGSVNCQCSIWFANVCEGWSQVSFFGERGLHGSVFLGVGAWICGQICVGSFPKRFNLRSIMGPWRLC